MAQIGLRGSAQARVDAQGRLKVPAHFRSVLLDQYGSDVYVTSLTGTFARVYPMSVWIVVEAKLAEMPPSHPSRQKFLDRTSYYGQVGEMDSQGRVLVPPTLRETAAISGAVRVFGQMNVLEVWNEELFGRRMADSPWTEEDALEVAKYGA